MCTRGLFASEPRKWICLNYNQGLQVVATLSIICALLTIILNSFYLDHFLTAQSIPAYDEKNETYHRSTYLAWKLDMHFIYPMKNNGLIDNLLFVLVLCTSTGIAFGILQFLVGIWVLIAPPEDQIVLARLWFLIQLSVLIAIGTSYLVFIVNSVEITRLIHLFLSLLIVQILLLIYFFWLLMCFSQSRDKVLNAWSLLWDVEKILWVDGLNKTTRVSMV